MWSRPSDSSIYHFVADQAPPPTPTINPPLWYHKLYGHPSRLEWGWEIPRDSPSISPATLAERGLGHHNDENNNGAAFGGAHRALPRPVLLSMKPWNAGVWPH